MKQNLNGGDVEEREEELRTLRGEMEKTEAEVGALRLQLEVKEKAKKEDHMCIVQLKRDHMQELGEEKKKYKELEAEKQTYKDYAEKREKDFQEYVAEQKRGFEKERSDSQEQIKKAMEEVEKEKGKVHILEKYKIMARQIQQEEEKEEKGEESDMDTAVTQTGKTTGGGEVTLSEGDESEEEEEAARNQKRRKGEMEEKEKDKGGKEHKEWLQKLVVKLPEKGDEKETEQKATGSRPQEKAGEKVYDYRNRRDNKETYGKRSEQGGTWQERRGKEGRENRGLGESRKEERSRSKEGGHDRHRNREGGHERDRSREGGHDYGRASSSTSYSSTLKRPRGDYEERSNKRTKETTQEVNMAKAKMRDLFVGDSVFGVFPDQTAIQVVAWEQRWEVVVRRGGRVRDLKELIKRKTNEGEEYEKIYIWMGQNDCSDVQKRLDNRTIQEGEEKEELKELMDSTVGEVTKEWGEKVVLLGVVPSMDITEGVREAADEILNEYANRCGGKFIDWASDREERQRILEYGMRDGKDRCHMNHEETWRVIQKAVKEAEERRLELKWDLTFDPTLEWPGKCFRCGRKYHGTGNCEVKLGCTICNRGGHVRSVCLSQFRMCFVCGGRGHEKKACPYQRPQRNWNH